MSARAWLILLLASCAAVAEAAPATWDKPASPAKSSRALRSVIRAAYKSARRGDKPVVVVDIDDTAANGRLRLRAAAARAGLPTEHLTTANDLYAGLSGKALEQKHAAFGAAYFNDPKLAKLDTAQRGAPAFLRALTKAGARVMYVSGRWESTRGATEKYLRKLDLPLARSEDLLLNPSEKQLASDWKKSAQARIASAGKPLAFFDNEAESIAHYKATFPGARAFRLATFRFREAPEKPRGVLVIDDFSLDR